MKYKLTDDQFQRRLKEFLGQGPDDFVPLMLDSEIIDRVKTLGLASFDEMPGELAAELLAENS